LRDTAFTAQARNPHLGCSALLFARRNRGDFLGQPREAMMNIRAAPIDLFTIGREAIKMNIKSAGNPFRGLL
jgi:hypothetical protein